MANRHSAHFSAMGSSRFEFVNDLDQRITERNKIYEQFKIRVITDYKNALNEYSKSDLVTFDSLLRYGIGELIDEFS